MGRWQTKSKMTMTTRTCRFDMAVDALNCRELLFDAENQLFTNVLYTQHNLCGDAKFTADVTR